MNQKAKPLTRQEVMALAVTDADAFTALRYLRHRENVPSIPDLEEKGATALPGIEGSLMDLYHTLWNPEPSVREEVAPARRYWKELLGQTLKSSAYQELHSQTQFKELQSVLGTISMGESVIGMVPKRDQEKLQKLQAAQADADNAEEQSQQAQANANASQQLADAAAQQAGQGQSGPGQPQPSSGKPSASAHSGASADKQGKPSGSKGHLTPDQAKAIANQLGEEAAKAQQDAEAAKAQADQAKTKAEELAEELMGKPGSNQAEEKLRELTRIGLQAAKDAQAKVEEVSKTLEAWGLDEGQLQRKSLPEVMGVLERMKKNAALKKFAALLGRIHKIAARKACSKISGEGARITTVETGRDLKRAHRSEIMALINPALRVKALQRWTRGELWLYGEKTKAKLGHGPVIVCEDGSGSMDGAKQQWAKAVTLALAHYAKLQHRSYAWIHFGATSTPLEVLVCKGGNVSPEQMLTIAETFRNASGTDFEVPLTKALEVVKQAGLTKADICFITDGECAVSDKFLREFKAAKKALEINVFTVLCDAGSSADAAVKEFSDKIEKASAFTAEEAESKLIRHL